MTWIPVTKQLPPNGEVVETKTEHANSSTVTIDLMYCIDQWFHPDRTVYYYYPKPTHWRKKQNQ